MEFHKPVGRLEEAIRVIRALWESQGGTVDFAGDFFNLKDAVFGLPLYEDTPPPIWLAAHGPRMLRICGELADGWLPTNIKPDAYGEKLGRIRASAEKAGRDADAITPSMLAYVMCAPDEETLERMCDSPLARLLFAAVDLPQETYERYGSTSPFEGGTGFHSFLPSTVTREEALRIVDHIPGGIVRDHYAVRDARTRSPSRSAPTRRSACATSCCGTSRRSATRTLSVYSFRALRELRGLLEGAPTPVLTDPSARRQPDVSGP